MVVLFNTGEYVKICIQCKYAIGSTQTSEFRLKTVLLLETVETAIIMR